MRSFLSRLSLVRTIVFSLSLVGPLACINEAPTPPVEQVAPDGGDDEVSDNSVSDNSVSDNDESASDGDETVADDDTATGDDDTPTDSDDTPTSGDDTASSDAPTNDDDTSNGNESVSDGDEPVVDDDTATGDDDTPTGDDDAPVSDDAGTGRCCRAGTVCAVGQTLCTEACPNTELACAAGQTCQQGSNGEFDTCVDSCSPAQRCGAVCCANGVSCEAGSCVLPDLEISADDVGPAEFGSIEVPANSCEIQEGCFAASGTRSVVSIRAHIANVGAGALALGAPWDSSLFHASLCADAYLLPNFIAAEVLADDGEVLAAGHLPTSCIADEEGQFRCALQGLPPGGLSEQPNQACNSLDVTDLPPGSYTLRLTVNPDRVLGESDFENNAVEVVIEKSDCEGVLCGGACCPSGVQCFEEQCLLPDLRVNQEAIEQSLYFTYQEFGADSCELAEMCVSGSGRRRLLNFEGRIENWGPGDLSPGLEADNPLFELSECHGHYHFLDFTDYRLLNEDGAVVAQGHKQSFCLLDMAPVEGATIPVPPGVHPEPGLTGCNHLSAGWADIYGVGTPCQWVDVTDVAPGDYVLQVAVNPIGVLAETSTENNVVQVSVQISEEEPCQEIEICGDATDQDCDSMPDDFDPDCANVGDFEPVEGNTECAAALQVEGSGKYQLDVGADVSSITPSCGGTGADGFFSFTLDASEVVFASSEFSDFDTVLALYTADCSQPDIACADDNCGESAHLARLLEPGSYVLVVKAKEPGASGKLRVALQRTGVQQGTLLTASGVVSGDTSASPDGVEFVCGADFGLGSCCDQADSCHWAGDGVCDCYNLFGWDDQDCGPDPIELPPGVGENRASAPDDVYFLPLCAQTSVVASTCGSASYDSALGFFVGSLEGAALSCSVDLSGGLGNPNLCSSDPNGAAIVGSVQEATVSFIVVDGETEGAAGEYQLYTSY